VWGLGFLSFGEQVFIDATTFSTLGTTVRVLLGRGSFSNFKAHTDLSPGLSVQLLRAGLRLWGNLLVAVKIPLSCRFCRRFLPFPFFP